MPGQAYFTESQPELAERLDYFLAALRTDLLQQPAVEHVCALFLAGGYGRGEGGVFRGEPTVAAQLYNDLEFYLVIGDSAPAGTGSAWTARWSHLGEEQLGIEVEFKILRDRALRQGQPSMFYYDLLAAHRLIYHGDGPVYPAPEILLDPTLIPPHEATRLLFNRGSGLFFSAFALGREDEKTRNGFIERNHAKVRLALGDAVLALNGRYHFSCVERERRLMEPLPKEPPDAARIREWHQEGVVFKLRPRHVHPSLRQLLAAQSELSEVWMRTFLWLERQRLGRVFPEPSAYAQARGRLYPHTPALRNLALHSRDLLRHKSTLPGWLDYPRAALQRALVCLLETNPDLTTAAGFLRCKPTPEAAHAAYERWWRRYN